jgi:hypothetical protein
MEKEILALAERRAVERWDSRMLRTCPDRSEDRKGQSGRKVGIAQSLGVDRNAEPKAGFCRKNRAKDEMIDVFVMRNTVYSMANMSWCFYEK